MHLFMRIFTRLTASCLVIVIAASMVSCTTGQGGHTSAGLSISLTSDKDAIFADGADAVTFTVIDNSSREDVTSASVIYMLSEDGSSSQTSASFSTETPGSYTFYAEYSGVRSAEISITAHGENAEGITLHVSKNSIYNDGGDFTVITLTDADGNDVTELGTFYANGEQLEDNLFSTTIGSLAPVEISAAIGYNPVSNTAAVTATSSYQFASRSLLEEITKTNCPHCLIMQQVISELAQDNPQMVIAYNVHNTKSDVFSGNYTSVTQEFSKAFCDFILPDEGDRHTAAPKTFFNRSKKNYVASPNLSQEFRNMALGGPKDVAIALCTESTAQTVSVKATIGSKKDFSGHIVAVLVDNGINTSSSYRVMRAYYPSVEGQPQTFTAGQTVRFSADFDLTQLNVTAVENCEVIVFVTDADGQCEIVQVAGSKEKKGY